LLSALCLCSLCSLYSLCSLCPLPSALLWLLSLSALSAIYSLPSALLSLLSLSALSALSALLSLSLSALSLSLSHTHPFIVQRIIVVGTLGVNACSQALARGVYTRQAVKAFRAAVNAARWEKKN
jgi:hypothetical protein